MKYLVIFMDNSWGSCECEGVGCKELSEIFSAKDTEGAIEHVKKRLHVLGLFSNYSSTNIKDVKLYRIGRTEIAVPFRNWEEEIWANRKSKEKDQRELHEKCEYIRLKNKFEGTKLLLKDVP